MTEKELIKLAETNIKKGYKKETISVLKAGIYTIYSVVYVFMCIFLLFYLHNAGFSDLALTSIFVLMIAVPYVPIKTALKGEDNFKCYQKLIIAILNMVCTYIYAIIFYLVFLKTDFPTERIAVELGVSCASVLYTSIFGCIFIVFILHSFLWQPFDNIIRNHKANVKAEKERIMREEILPNAGNDELKKEIISQYPRYLRYVDKQTEELCRIAVEKDVVAITEIKDDDMKSKFCNFK